MGYPTPMTRRTALAMSLLLLERAYANCQGNEVYHNEWYRAARVVESMLHEERRTNGRATVRDEHTC